MPVFFSIIRQGARILEDFRIYGMSLVISRREVGHFYM
jgi:hypothetical protein